MDLLKVNNLKVHFRNGRDLIKAVDGVTFNLSRGRVLGIAGQSGSGKSVTANAILRLLNPPGKIVDGQIIINNKDIVSLSDKEMARLRGRDVFLIFQSPASALNPSVKVGLQIAEGLVKHKGLSWRSAKTKAVELMEQVGMPAHKSRAYPFELSGGMRQRILIAMALGLEPDLLIADEPTTSLDAGTQVEILHLFKTWQDKLAGAIIFISHDLRILFDLADEIAVMHQGRIVDRGTPYDLLRNPSHSHTMELFHSLRELYA